MISKVCRLSFGFIAKKKHGKNPCDLRNLPDDPVVLLGEDKDPSLGDALLGMVDPDEVAIDVG